MELKDKEKAILGVLEQRVFYCEQAIEANEKEIAQRQKQIDYLRAKKEGYNQAIDLLKEDLEGIYLEYDEPAHK